jgi:polar amino acid transport system substrate-binding protein
MRKSVMMIGLMVCVLALLGTAREVICEEESKPDRELIASGHPEWPPVMFKDGDVIVGAGPELAKKIFDDLGIKIQVRYTGTWEDVVNKAKSGQIDVLVAAYKTKEREDFMVYSDPYTTDPLAIFVASDKTFKFSTSADLVGKIGVGMIGESYGQEFDDYSADHLNLRRVQTSAEAFDILANHQADYFVDSLYAGNLEIKKNARTGIVSLPTFVSEQNFYITISKQSPFAQYLPEVNRLIKKYKEDGTIDKLVAKYQ